MTASDVCSILHSAIKLFLHELNIETHRTTPFLKTKNSDIERLHGTLNEHLQVMEVGVSNKSLDLDNKPFKIFTNYNNTIHSTTKIHPIEFLIKIFY